MSTMFDDSDVDNPPVYKKGDIVWVKLSSYWWPGEVKNEEDLPSDLLADFKKPPLVIVKFFEEDSYEYIKHWSNIHPYDCDRKNDFIKKGMGGFRAKLSHMSTFPRDVTTAEERTNGDPNILSQPEFLPNKKINYDEIFGTPTPKKSSKGKTLSNKKPVLKDSKTPLVTHRRFIGNDDYKSFILVQEPCKDRQPDSEDEEIIKLNQEPEEILRCKICDFSTARLGVLLIHNKLHLEGNAVVTAKRKFKKHKEAGDTTESKSHAREKDAASTAKQKPRKPKIVQSEPKPAADAFANLLDEWDDSDEEVETPVKQKKSNHGKVTNSTSETEGYHDLFNSQEEEMDTTIETEDANNSELTDPNKNNTHDDIKNCFDFDEEEEEDESFLYPASTGRKIPRVIPEKPRASISELLELGDKEDEQLKSKSDKQPDESNTIPDEDDNRKKEILRVSQSFNRAPVVDDTLENTFKDLMEETEVPILDDLTQSLKPEQNFHDVRAIKFPDKGGTTLMTPTKSGTSKKKFVTSFEDFEAGFRKVDLTPSKERKEKDVNSNSDSDQKESSKDIATEELSRDSLSEEQKDISSEATSKTPSSTEQTPTVKRRRKFKQLIIEDDTEVLVDYDSSLSKSTHESPIDSELAGIKHDLESPDTTSERIKETQINTEMSLEQLTRDLESSNTSLDIISKDQESSVENIKSVAEEGSLQESFAESSMKSITEEQDHFENINRRSSRLKGSHIPDTPHVNTATETKKSKNRGVNRKGLEAKPALSNVESVDIKKGKSRSRKESERDQPKQETAIPVAEKNRADDVEKQHLRRGRSRKNELEVHDATLPTESQVKIDDAEVKTPTESHNLTVEPVPGAENVSPKSRKRSRRKLSSSSPVSHSKEVEHEDGLRTRSQKHRKIDDSNANTSVVASFDNTIKAGPLKATIKDSASPEQEIQPSSEKDISADSQKSNADRVKDDSDMLNRGNSKLQPSEENKIPDKALDSKLDPVETGNVPVDDIPNASDSKKDPTEKDLPDDANSNTEALKTPSTENKKLDSFEKDIISVKSARKGRSTRSSAVYKATTKDVEKLVEQPVEVDPNIQLEEATPKRRRGRSLRSSETVRKSTKTQDTSSSETNASLENTDNLSRPSKSDAEAKQAVTTDHVCADDDIETDPKTKVIEPRTDILLPTEYEHHRILRSEVESNVKNVSADVETKPKHKVTLSTKNVLVAAAVHQNEEVITPKKRLRSQRSNENIKDVTMPQDSGISEKLISPENAEKSSRTLRSGTSKSKEVEDASTVEKTNQKKEVTAPIKDSLLPAVCDLIEDVKTPKRRRGRSQRFNKSVDNLDAKQDLRSRENVVNLENTDEDSQILRSDIESDPKINATEVSIKDVSVPVNVVPLPATCEVIEFNVSANELTSEDPVCAQTGSETLVDSMEVERKNESVDQVEDVSSAELSRLGAPSVEHKASVDESALDENKAVVSAHATVSAQPDSEILKTPGINTPSLPAEVCAVPLEDIPLPEPPVEVAMLDIPVEDIPLPPSPPPEAHKPCNESLTVTTQIQKTVDPVIEKNQDSAAEPYTTQEVVQVENDFSNIELESIPIPASKSDDKEDCQKKEEREEAVPVESNQDTNLTFSLENIPIPEPLKTSENDSSCDTNLSDKSIQSSDMPKSFQQASDDLEMTDCKPTEQDNKVEAFNLEDIPIPATTPKDEKKLELADLNIEENSETQIENGNSLDCDASFQTFDFSKPTALQGESSSPEKPVATDMPTTTVKSFEDFMTKAQEANAETSTRTEQKPQNAGIVCETIYGGKPEVRRSDRMKMSRRRWDMSEPTQSSFIESSFQPEDVLNAHDESQNVAHSDIETENQSKQLGHLENSDASLGEETFNTSLENMSNDSFGETQSEFMINTSATSELGSESIPEDSKIREGNDQPSADFEKPDHNLEDPISECAIEDIQSLTETADTPELVTAESEETCNIVKSKNRGKRRKQHLSAEGEPAVEFMSNLNTDVENIDTSKLEEKCDANQEVSGTSISHISAEDTIDEIFETNNKTIQINEKSDKDNHPIEDSFSFKRGRSSKQTQPLDHFKTLFDDEEAASSQPELKSSFQDSPETVVVSKTTTSTSDHTTENEIILPLKKSKRVNEISSLISSDSFTRNSDSEFSFRSACDDSFMSTSMRNNIDRLINEIDSVDTSGIETLSSSSMDSPMFSQITDTEKSHVLEPLVSECKSVPPKKKKIEIQGDQQPDDKSEESAPQAPKKKMQKLFESSKSPGKSVDVPLMSPLAKKKSFYFQHDFEKFEQSLLTKDGLSSLSSSEDSSADESLDSQELPVEVAHPSDNEQQEKQDKIELPQQNCDTFSNLTKGDLEASTPEPTTEVEIEQKTSTDNDENSISNLMDPTSEQLTQAEKETEQTRVQPLEDKFSLNQETVKSDTKIEEPEVKVTVPAEPELIPITVAPTVMSEKDLDDAQVEITSDVVISEKKPSSLGSFSVNFDTAIVTKTDNLTAVKVEATKIPDTVGTEFTSKAMVKEFDNKSLKSQPNTYALKSELLDILEGNSNSSTNSSGSEQKFKTSFDNYDKKNTVQGIIDFEDAIPPQIVITNKITTENVLLDSPKLLERLSMSTESGTKSKPKTVTEVKSFETTPKTLPSKIAKPTGLPKPGQKIIIRTTKSMVPVSAKTVGSKPIILSEQIIRRAGTATSIPKVATQGVKREYEDIEDVEAAFIIPKIAKKSVEEETVNTVPEKPSKTKGSKAGKPKILQQTIISPKGDVLPQRVAATNRHNIQLQNVQGQLTRDDTVFDINSMPIVLSDDLLTPESIQNMPVVLSDEIVSNAATASASKTQEKLTSAIPKKTIVSTIGAKQIIFKTTQSSSIPLSTIKQPGKLKNLPASIASTIQSKLAQGGTTAFIATGTTPDGKTAKYVLVPPSVTPASAQVKAIKQNIIKKQPVAQSKPATVGGAASTNVTPVVGNKIMIVTDAQGQQTRVMLTPQQQKVFMPAVGKTKTLIKGAIPKALLENATGVTIAGPSGVTAKATPILSQGVTSTQPKCATPSSQTSVTSGTGLLMPVAKNIKSSLTTKKVAQKFSKPQKMLLIKNYMGETVRKIQATDNADLDRQVAEQIEAIKASSRLQQTNQTSGIINYTRSLPNTSTGNRAVAIKKSFIKKVEVVKSRVPAQALDEGERKQDVEMPALSPLSPQTRIPQVSSQPTQSVSKVSALKRDQSQSRIPTGRTTEQKTHVQTASAQKPVSKNTAAPTPKSDKPTENKRAESPVRQVVIQDGVGNLTTVTVGQILAIPSETVDGQPQSYMLVTVDESGNLTPLNNDALMSLDPSLGLGGDINNVVLQVDQGQGTVAAAVKPTGETKPAIPVSQKNKVEERLKPEKPKTVPQPSSQLKPVMGIPNPPEVPIAVEQPVVVGEGVVPGDVGGQQLIVTGDPVATQKFLESLSDGSTDLAGILAKAEGGSVIIQTDGQQILIRTNTDSQSELGISDSELLASHKPNQDILAAALANTDVFQSTEQTIVNQSIVKGVSSAQLSPGTSAGLFPMQVGNVLETSLTLSSPIMTPLELPSTNCKKIGDQADVLGQVPKNVDLPITITDPNISQTVAHQPTLMELSLPIPDNGSSQDINSPSFPYALTTIEESVGLSQKSFNGSMPLLTEDVIEHRNVTSPSSDKVLLDKDSSSNFSANFESLPLLDTIDTSKEDNKTNSFGTIESLPMLSEDVVEDSGSSMGSSKLLRSSPKSLHRDIVDEGLSTLGGEMCSSLSEPPPDMFDLSSLAPKEEEISSDLSSIPEPETLSMNSENSNEIPLQPPIVASLSDLKRHSDDDSEGSDEKRSRYDD